MSRITVIVQVEGELPEGFNFAIESGDRVNGELEWCNNCRMFHEYDTEMPSSVTAMLFVRDMILKALPDDCDVIMALGYTSLIAKLNQAIEKMGSTPAVATPVETSTAERLYKELESVTQRKHDLIHEHAMVVGYVLDKLMAETTYDYDRALIELALQHLSDVHGANDAKPGAPADSEIPF